MAVIKNAIVEMIEKAKCLPTPVEESANLYANLGFDSLTYIALLIQIEEKYAITFDLTEMEACLEVGRLIALVESKVRKRGQHD